MKVESLIIKNFKAISEERLSINGNNVYVMGPNGVGKTSFIDAIFKILSGKELPEKPTKSGEGAGKVQIDLGDVIVKATFNEKDEKVSVSLESKDGAVFKSPRTLLNEKVGIVDFDIDSFFNKSPKDQVDFIKNLVGIDFTDLDEQYKEYYDERTFVNRKVKELEAQVKEHPVDLKVQGEKKPVFEIQEKLEKANQKNLKAREVAERIKSRTEQVLSLKNKIAQMEAEIAEAETLNTQALDWIKNNPVIDTQSISDELKAAIEFNEALERQAKAIEIRSELHKYTTNQEDLNKRLNDIEQTKRRIISESNMPVPGLSFEDNRLIYNGLPFDRNQINTAQRIIIGLQINRVLLNEVNIARFDGSLLDRDNLKVVEDWAKENDLQLFVEFVERDTEGLKIEIKE